MAEKRSTYYFDKYEDYEEAKSHIYEAMPSDYNDSIYFESSGSDYWVEIWSNCSDAPLAADIIREHRGKYYSRY